MSVAAIGPVASRITEEAQRRLNALESWHRHELSALELLDAHYQGRQPLSYMAPELIMKLGSRLRQVVIHWPELAIDSVEERLDVEGFRLGDADADERLWDMWQANGLDVGSHQAHVDALVMKRSYVVVGSRGATDLDPSSGVGADIPLISWQSPLETFAHRDPRTRMVDMAATWWDETPYEPGPDNRRAALYLRGATSWWTRKGNQWVLDEDNTVGVDYHGLGVVPVVPLVNRPRTSTRSSLRAEGWSDLEAIIPLSDAACKAATDMMVGAEYHSMPRRYAIGYDLSDFTDVNGNQIPALSQVAGHTWVLPAPDTTGGGASSVVGQFPESSLTNFHETIKLLAQLVASVSGLPPHYLGSSTDNPASADAIRSSEARLVKRVERKQRAFGESWEQVMRLAWLVADGEVPDSVRAMETIWRDASTPTIAQSADAAVKLFTAGIIPKRQVREDLGYSSVVIDRMQEEDEKDLARAAESFGLGPSPVIPGVTMPEPPAPAAPSTDGGQAA